MSHIEAKQTVRVLLALQRVVLISLSCPATVKHRPAGQESVRFPVGGAIISRALQTQLYRRYCYVSQYVTKLLKLETSPLK